MQTLKLSILHRTVWPALLVVALGLSIAPALGQAALQVYLISSVETIRPGHAFSVSVMLHSNAPEPIPVTLTMPIDAHLTLLNVTTAAGTCLPGATVACHLQIKAGAPASVLVQFNVAADAPDGTVIAINAHAEDGENTAVPTPVRVRVSGTPVPTQPSSRSDTAPTASPHTPTIPATAVSPMPTSTDLPTSTPLPPSPTPSQTPAPGLTASPLPTQQPSPGVTEVTATSDLSAARPDILENNWSPAHAAPIAVGQIYDLSFVCPQPDACVGGDHDYLRVAVKHNLTYLIGTFDLAPGVDTVLDLFWGDEQFPVATNDDAYPGYGFASYLLWTAPSDGEALIRVGPRTGGLIPAAQAGSTGQYRFAMALVGSDLAQQVAERIVAEAHLPTSTPTPVPTATAMLSATLPVAPSQPVAIAPAMPSSPPMPTAITDAFQGAAQVIVDTTLHLDPAPEAPILAELPADSQVILLGAAQGLWVRARSEASAIPGWIRVRDLLPIREGAATVPPSMPGAPSLIDPSASIPTNPTITSLPPLATAPPEPARRIPVQVSILVHDGPSGQPLGGMRVRLVTIFGDHLTEALTPGDGSPLTLTRDVLPGTALLVQVTAAGLQAPVDLANPTMIFTLPGDGGQ